MTARSEGQVGPAHPGREAPRPMPERWGLPAGRGVALTVAALLLAAPVSAAGQGSSGAVEDTPSTPEASPRDTVDGPVSPDSAAKIRAAMRRPPSQPPFDALDVVALPFRVGTYPLVLAGEVIGAGLDMLSRAGPPPFYLRFYRSLSRWGLQGGVESVGPRSGLAGELELDRWEPLFLRTAWSLRGSQDHRAGLRWSGDAGRLEAAFGFHRDAEPRFWGLGPRTPEADRSSFEHDRVHATLRGELETSGPLTLGLVAGWEENQVEGGSDEASPDLAEVFDPATLFGADERTRFLRVGPRVELDLTHRAGFQRRGVLVGGGTDLYRGVGSTDADFHRFRGWVEGYIPANRRQTLALRAEAEANRGDSGRGVPFTHMPTLGDGPGGRAYADGRFRDRDLLAMAAEWRWEVWRELQGRFRVEGFVFFEEGTAVGDLSTLGSSDLRPSWGGGLRLADHDGLEARAFLADGEEGARFQADLSASF